MRYNYRNRGTCSQMVTFDMEDGRVSDVVFTGGCEGNLKAISRLIEGMKAEDIIEKVKGVNCGGKGTSCGDQLAIALTAAIEAEKK